MWWEDGVAVDDEVVSGLWLLISLVEEGEVVEDETLAEGGILAVGLDGEGGGGLEVLEVE